MDSNGHISDINHVCWPFACAPHPIGTGLEAREGARGRSSMRSTKSEQQIRRNNLHSTRFSCCLLFVVIFHGFVIWLASFPVGRDFFAQFARNVELASPFDMEFEMT